ncbi:MAG: GNAT family N-acetyltransferase [Bacteroidota bacterium]
MADFQVAHIPLNDIDPARWDAFITASPQGSVYALHGFLFALRKDWRALIVLQQDEWQAVMPYCLNKRWRFTSLPQPTFTQYLGICFQDRQFDTAFQAFRWKNRLVSRMVDDVAEIDLFVQSFSPAFDYPMPFHWAGYSIHNRYTYICSLEDDFERHFSPSLRRHLRKANKHQLQCCSLDDLSPLLELYRLNAEKGHDILGQAATSHDKMHRLINFLKREKRGEIRAVKNQNGDILAAGVFVHFKQKGLYLMGAMHPESQAYSPMSFLMWEEMKRAKDGACLSWDFEGSMIEGVERFFRGFGAKPQAYLQLRKNALPLMVRWIQGFT